MATEGMSAATRGPLIEVFWARRDRLRTITIVGVIGLIIAGTMAILGLPPVDLHGPLHRMGIMDPLCGGTRAARLTAQGHLAEAWRYNPLGIFATFAALAAVVRLSIGLTTHRWLDIRVAWTPSLVKLSLVIGLLLVVVLEIRQQGRAELLLRRY